MRKFLALVMLANLAVLSVLVVAAAPVLAADLPGTSANSLTVATALVVAWGWIAPLTIYKWIKADDARMKAITIGASVVIAAIALLVGEGGLKVDWSTPAGIYAFGLIVYGEQQLVWTLLKDRASTTKAVN